MELLCGDVLLIGRYISFVNTAKKPIWDGKGVKGREEEWTDTANVAWSEVTGLCGFWDGSCERGVCGAGILIQVFTQALGWVTINRKCGPVPGQNSQDAGMGGCAMLMSNLIQWVDICTNERWVLSGFSPARCIFRRNALHAGAPLPSPPHPRLSLWVACGSGV